MWAFRGALRRLRRLAPSVGDTRHVQGASHFHLLNHPRAYEHLREWLGAPALVEGAEISSSG